MRQSPGHKRWVLKFGPIVARNLREIRPKAYTRWHLDEMVISIAGRQMYMWRAVDSEGEVLEILVQPQRDKAAAVRLLRKLLRRQGFVPTVIVTDKLSYGAALREIGFSGDCVPTIERRPRIRRFDDANERCKPSTQHSRPEIVGGLDICSRHGVSITCKNHCDMEACVG
jgi:transposase-like protein